MSLRNGLTIGKFSYWSYVITYDETMEAEYEFNALRMRDNQCASDYLVRFSSLAVHVPWGKAALRFRMYEGLPPHIKDELSEGKGKPQTLAAMRSRIMNIDARYWECQQKKSHEQKPNPPKQSTSSNTPSASTPSTSTKTLSRSDNKQVAKTKDTKPQVDLTGKLNSRGKLTQQEHQQWI